MDAGPFGWFQNPPLRRLILTRGLMVLGLALGLSLLLTVLALFALAVGAAQTFSGFTGGGYSPAGAQGPSADQLLGAFLVIYGFVFFTAHLAPFNADISLFGSSIYGVGSLLITAAVVLFSYRSGGLIERRFPYSVSNGESVMRAAFIAVPYWVGCLLLFLVSSIHAQSSQFGNATLGPSAIGLFTPLLLVGGAAAIGARRQRGGPVSATSRYAVRGAVLALFAIAIGMLASVVGAILAALIGAATHSSAFSSSSSTSTGASPTVSPTAAGPVFALLAVLVAIFYIPNGLAWLWGSALGFDLASVGWLILVFAVIGALLGALTIQSRSDPTEQVSFAVTFGLASFVLTLISRPTIGTWAVGGNPWIVLLVGLVLGVGLAIVGPYAARTGLGQSALALPLMTAALRRLPLPGEGGAPLGASVGEHGGLSASIPDAGGPPPGWSSPLSGPATAVLAPPMPAARVEPMRIHFGKRAKIVTAVGIVAIVALVGVNIYLASATTAQAAASAYEQAVGNNDASAIWSHLQVREPATLGFQQPQALPRLLSQNDLKAMLSLPQNAHQARTNIAAGNIIQTADNATVQVSFQQQGQSASETLTMVRDNSQHQFLFYPVWKVAVVPGVVSVNLPARGARIAIDGTQLPPDAGAAYVLPGTHKVTLLPSGPFAATDTIAVVGSQAPAQVSFKNMQLTSEAKTAAATTVKNYFTSCLQTTNGFGSCPQRLNEYVTSPIQWQLVGDPTTSLNVSVEPNSQSILATGHFLMTASFSSDAGPVHRVSGGAYCLPVAWNGQSFEVQNTGFGFGCQQIAPLPNPGANQTSLLAAAQAGWQSCLKATVLNPPDCPASGYGYQPTNVKWTSTTDPMAGAQVSWDGVAGVYKVTGNYSLLVKYDDAFGSSRSNNLSGSYTAVVTWDGQTANLANIGQGNQ
jgi:hypothetical protein